jgi:hypothetical protein
MGEIECHRCGRVGPADLSQWLVEEVPTYAGMQTVIRCVACRGHETPPVPSAGVQPVKVPEVAEPRPAS